jgi:hypothetical protein
MAELSEELTLQLWAGNPSTKRSLCFAMIGADLVEDQ